RVAQTCFMLCGCRRRHDCGDEIAGAFLQTTNRGPCLRITVDAPVRRIGRLIRDLRELERLRVHPARVAIGAGEVYGSVRYYRIDELAARLPTGTEGGHEPAATGNPRLLTMSIGTFPDRRHILRGGG